MVRGVAVVALAALVSVLQAPLPAGGQVGNSLFVAPTCMTPGTARILVLGQGWLSSPVQLSMVASTGATTPLGTVNPQTVGQRVGAFSFVATVTATTGFEVVATQSDARPLREPVAVQNACGFQLSARPTCLSGPGTVEVVGSGFLKDSEVGVIVDPFGDAERELPNATTGGTGSFTATVDLPARQRPIPIVVSQSSPREGAAGELILAVVFIDPCPPPGTTTSATRPRSTTTTATTAAVKDTTTTVTTITQPPEVPPETPPGTTVQVSISPKTVRPGRCVVLVMANAPAGAPVVARFADGPPVNAQVGPDGRTVVSVCVPHDSGGRLGPVAIVLSIGSFGPAPISTVLRVPSRPQPPLLQSAGDTLRS